MIYRNKAISTSIKKYKSIKKIKKYNPIYMKHCTIYPYKFFISIEN